MRHNPDGLWENESGIPFGDWLSPEGKTDQTLIATAYWAYDVTLMREMAHATRTHERMSRSMRRCLRRFARHLRSSLCMTDGFVAGADKSPSPFGAINKPDAKSKGGDTQTGYVLALHMNLVPENLRAAAAQKLVDKIEANHGLLGTGFLGTPYLLEELTKTGHADAGIQAAAEYGVSVLGLPGGAWRDDDVGAVERRPDEGRPEHEFV